MAKWQSEKALQIAVKRREVKGKGEKEKSKRQGEKERYTNLSAQFQRVTGREKKPFLSEQCQKWRKIIEWERI